MSEAYSPGESSLLPSEYWTILGSPELCVIVAAGAIMYCNLSGKAHRIKEEKKKDRKKRLGHQVLKLVERVAMHLGNQVLTDG